MNAYDFYTFASHLSSTPPVPTQALATLYLGPDSVVPLASIIATIIGFILMFGRAFLGVFRRGFQSLSRTSDNIESPASQEETQE